MLIGYPPFFTDSPLETCKKIMNWRENLIFPKNISISHSAKDIIKRLIVDIDNRIGHNGVEEIKSHSFFKGIDWSNLKKSIPFFVPKMESKSDAKYFDSFKEEDPFYPMKDDVGKQVSKDICFVDFDFSIYNKEFVMDEYEFFEKCVADVEKERFDFGKKGNIFEIEEEKEKVEIRSVYYKKSKDEDRKPLMIIDSNSMKDREEEGNNDFTCSNNDKKEKYKENENGIITSKSTYTPVTRRKNENESYKNIIKNMNNVSSVSNTSKKMEEKEINQKNERVISSKEEVKSQRKEEENSYINSIFNKISLPNKQNKNIKDLSSNLQKNDIQKLKEVRNVVHQQLAKRQVTNLKTTSNSRSGGHSFDSNKNKSKDRHKEKDKSTPNMKSERDLSNVIKRQIFNENIQKIQKNEFKKKKEKENTVLLNLNPVKQFTRKISPNINLKNSHSPTAKQSKFIYTYKRIEKYASTTTTNKKMMTNLFKKNVEHNQSQSRSKSNYSKDKVRANEECHNRNKLNSKEKSFPITNISNLNIEQNKEESTSILSSKKTYAKHPNIIKPISSLYKKSPIHHSPSPINIYKPGKTKREEYSKSPIVNSLRRDISNETCSNNSYLKDSKKKVNFEEVSKEKKVGLLKMVSPIMNSQLKKKKGEFEKENKMERSKSKLGATFKVSKRSICNKEKKL